jgi:formate/nitrite transporter FocA (FNT family)
LPAGGRARHPEISVPQPDHDTAGDQLDLSEHELEEAEKRSSVRVHVVHEAIRKEGEEELKRSTSALAWSGFAAGLSMGFSFIAEGLIRSHLPDAAWRPLLAKFGYSFGFVLVVMGRQQLYTENTLTPILPLLQRRDASTFWHVMRLWATVLCANIAGAILIAFVLAHSAALRPEAKQAMFEIGAESAAVSFGLALLRGIFAGWLIAFMVWMLPFADTARLPVIVGLTWLVALGGFTHIVAGSIEVVYLMASGALGWQQVAGGYMLPTLIGNTLGGVSLVAALNHAQVVQ